jgi:hypothetical protein
LYLTQLIRGKLTFYCRVLKSKASAAFVSKAVDKIKTTIFSNFQEKRK